MARALVLHGKTRRKHRLIGIGVDWSNQTETGRFAIFVPLKPEKGELDEGDFYLCRVSEFSEAVRENEDTPEAYEGPRFKVLASQSQCDSKAPCKGLEEFQGLPNGTGITPVVRQDMATEKTQIVGYALRRDKKDVGVALNFCPFCGAWIREFARGD
jgi:hypothetical protein